MKIGGHCVLYGPEIATNTEAVLNRLKTAGAEGCEIGQRFFGVEKRDELCAALQAQNIELAGMHCNGLKLIDLVNAPEKAEEALVSVAKLLATMPNKNIIATGGVDLENHKEDPIANGAPDPELHDPEQVVLAAKRLNEMARKIKEEYGVQVHYHNHSWEFADDGLIWFALAEHAPEVMFALDTGWAAVSGFDPVDLLEKYPDRFAYVHLRDFIKTENAGQKSFGAVHAGYVDLGAGDMNYPRLMKALHKVLGADDWAIVEYEIGNFDQQSYTKAISYLRGVRDMLQA